MITSNTVKSLASSLGFDACGIVSLNGDFKGHLPFQEDLDRLKNWVAEGRHGTMKYLEDFEARAKKFWESFPEAKSIIVIGVNYYSDIGRHCEEAEARRSNPGLVSFPAAARNDDQPKGRIARYAWGKDYHRVIGKRLEEFRGRLSEVTGQSIRAEICVDTKPLLERSLAQKAGLGFIGKQSQLLSPKFGPWLFLGELVTDLELEPDRPYMGDCGNCTICIDHCPTQAILPEGGIDARRCISYLTIEHKGDIPEGLKRRMGDWVFGCDLCLQVCPYASKTKETAWEMLKPGAGFGKRLDLLELLRIPSNRAYQRHFEGTAVTRATRKQLLRNAAVVLENQEGETL